MLFKFASYLLGTNNETEQQQLSEESNANTQDTQLNENSSTSLLIEKEEDDNIHDVNNDENSLIVDDEKSINNQLNDKKPNDLIEDDYMYDEQLINCSKLKNSNSNLDLSKDDHLCDQLEDDDCEDDDQWIYIIPIKRKNEEEKTVTENSEQVENYDLDDEDDLIENRETSNENVPKKLQNENEQEIEKFNFYDYFNNKNGLTSVNEEQCSPVKSAKTSNGVKLTGQKLVNRKPQQLNRMEESWVIHPPPIFTLDNTFTIEENPLENLYIENPVSVMASCKSIDKENNSSTSSLTNSSLPLTKTTSTANRVLIDRNLNKNNNQSKEKAPIATSRNSMRKRENSTRKANRKQKNNKKSKSKSIDLVAVVQSNNSSPQKKIEKENVAESTSASVLNERQEKQLLAHYLGQSIQLATATSSTSNTIASPNSPNGSIHQSTNHQTHHTHHHYISNNNCIANFTANANVEHKKGSKSLRRNNKVALKRDNLSNKPFTLHRKCLM